MNFDERLHEELQALARAIEFPLAPDLAPRVRTRIAGESRSATTAATAPAAGWRLTRAPLMLRLAGVAVALLLALAAALVASPTTRDALARFFGLKRVQIIYEDTTASTPTPVTTATPLPTGTHEPGGVPNNGLDSTAAPAVVPATATPAPTSPALQLTGATTLEDARMRAPFQVLLPTYPEGLGAPDEVYLQEFGRPGESQVILRYSNDGGPPGQVDTSFTLYQFRVTGVFTKTVDSGTRIQELQVNGARGYWLEGAVHIIEYRAANDVERVEFKRQVVGNTLAWEIGDLTYRLETSLPLDEAIRIAESVR